MNNGNTKSKHALSHIGEVVSAALKNHRQAPQNTLTHIRDTWKEIAGDRTFPHTWPAGLNNGTLIIHVSNSTWLHHLGYRKGELLSGARRAAGNAGINDLRFKIGPVGDNRN